ncbi:NGG1p interacting factor NIF3 [Gammaproteobacteria bacterium SCGC AG-212-F23]|nr:NGG1p interacting factor NIF3 [Gammaproteobacteria bacterium SCGC AG-212-F23]
MYKICFYTPEDHAEKIKTAMFAEGAGKIGEYGCCAWQTLGQGQFMPLENSNAFIGDKNKLEKIPELKIEMVCEEKYIHAVINALKNTHPYEEPAYQVSHFETF